MKATQSRSSLQDCSDVLTRFDIMSILLLMISDLLGVLPNG